MSNAVRSPPLARSDITGPGLRAFFNVAKKWELTDANLMTDEHSGDTLVGREYASHGVTRHTAGRYVDGNSHSNTVESSFSLLTRGLIGVQPRYV